MSDSGWVHPQSDAEAAEAARATADLIKYARVVVVIGRDPDDPETVATRIQIDPAAAKICLLQAAIILHDMADGLVESHGDGVC